MTLLDQARTYFLNAAMRGGVNDDVSQFCLSKRMQVNFRLFENHGRAFRHVLKQRHDRQDLLNAKSNIRKKRLTITLANLDPCLPSVGTLGNFLDTKIMDQAHFTEPIRYHVLKRFAEGLVPYIPMLVRCGRG